ncbi:VWA domain-containing protein [Okeania sp. KiyG1]|uniref:vWA domain-containing protein n=1 Tax=Okeania sp. KiyG1 TaxID=2720165 RepID=UPI00192452C3|nr:VWA domain-containing protein [Okeania sp. KiyG1]GGA56591.1 hypothetical protein CYANOKiyG1_77540 [Okeania sp. KiyG1]
MTLEEDINFPDNPEPRCPVILLLDTSKSMSGERIQKLNSGIAAFKQEVEKDTIASLRVEVAIITFNNSAEMVQNFVTIDQFIPPKLIASGSTAMGEGIDLALNKLEARKSIYKEYGISYYQPWVFLITDGIPTDKWEEAAKLVKKAVDERKLSFFIVGVQGANLNFLRNIAHPNTPPVMLDGLKFQELFSWLSASLTRVSTSQVDDKINLPPIDGWAQVRA